MRLLPDLSRGLLQPLAAQTLKAGVAKSIYRVFLAGSPREKREVVQLVALNGVLTDRNAHLKLKRPAKILADRESVPYGVTDGT